MGDVPKNKYGTNKGIHQHHNMNNNNNDKVLELFVAVILHVTNNFTHSFRMHFTFLHR